MVDGVRAEFICVWGRERRGGAELRVESDDDPVPREYVRRRRLYCRAIRRHLGGVAVAVLFRRTMAADAEAASAQDRRDGVLLPRERPGDEGVRFGPRRRRRPLRGRHVFLQGLGRVDPEFHRRQAPRTLRRLQERLDASQGGRPRDDEPDHKRNERHRGGGLSVGVPRRASLRRRAIHHAQRTPDHARPRRVDRRQGPPALPRRRPRAPPRRRRRRRR
mmetsp:Transcript_11800/g.38831  ORF Transcript_11800/g.38831 Transcript_11800/m.38831 type:complete len:219 (-) Transcript_11800:19-675(-)